MRFQMKDAYKNKMEYGYLLFKYVTSDWQIQTLY